MPDAMPYTWAETTVVEAPEPFTNTADLVLGDGLLTYEKGYEFHRHRMTADAANWRMRDVMLCPKLGLVFKDKKAIDATRFGLHHGEETAAIARLEGAVRHLEGRRVFSGFNRYCSNYFHILTQIIPAIAGYQMEPGFRDGVVILGAPPPILGRALALANIEMPEILTVRPNLPPLAIDDLTFSSLLTGYEAPSRFCRSVFNRMTERAATRGMTTGPRMIYVSRADAAARPLRNEDALMTMLLRHRVEPVLLSKLSLDDQIGLFRNARLVIGPHGAGLSNIVFSRPGAVLYELLPHHLLKPCMNQLAQQSGVHYWGDVHQAEVNPGVWHHHTAWSVDVDAVERRLVEILAAYRPD